MGACNCDCYNDLMGEFDTDDKHINKTKSVENKNDMSLIDMKKLVEEYYKWIEENNLCDSPFGVFSFLLTKGLLKTSKD